MSGVVGIRYPGQIETHSNCKCELRGGLSATTTAFHEAVVRCIQGIRVRARARAGAFDVNTVQRRNHVSEPPVRAL